MAGYQADGTVPMEAGHPPNQENLSDEEDGVAQEVVRVRKVYHKRKSTGNRLEALYHRLCESQAVMLEGMLLSPRWKIQNRAMGTSSGIQQGMMMMPQCILHPQWIALGHIVRVSQEEKIQQQNSMHSKVHRPPKEKSVLA